MKTNNVKDQLPRVAIISDERFPFKGTNTQQVIKNASALATAGLPLDLIIPLQRRGLFQKGYDTAAEIYKYYNIPDNLKVKTIRTWPAGKYRIEKLTHSIAAPLFATKKKYDVIYTRNEIAAVFCLLIGRRVIFETYRRLGDEYPKLMGFLAKMARKDNFVGAILHSELSRDSIKGAGWPEEKLIPLHNGFDAADMKPVFTRKEARKELGLDTEGFYVVYTGNMQQNKGIESLIDTAALVPDVTFLLVGGSDSDIERLKDYGSEKEVSNIVFPGFQPIAEVSKYLYAADVLITPPVAAPLEEHGRTVLPFKTFLYMAAGRPIIAPDLPDSAEVLKDGDSALLVEPDKPEKTAEAIKKIQESEKLFDRLSAGALDAVKNLTWDERARKIINWLEERYAALKK